MALSKIQSESMNLADTYAFTGTVSGAGAMAVVSTGTSATGLSDLQVTLPTSGYSVLDLHIFGYYSSTATDLYGYFQTSGGSYRTGSSDYAWTNVDRKYGVTPQGGSENAVAFMRFNYHSSSDLEAGANDYLFRFTNNASTSLRTQVFHMVGGDTGDSNHHAGFGSAMLNTAEANDKFKISPVSGTFSHGGYVLYGLVSS